MTTTEAGPIHLNFEERFTVALMRAGMSLTAFADHVGTTRTTLWRWSHLKDVPNTGALRVLAMEADVPYEWLRPSPDEIEEGRNQYTPRDSNPEPTDWGFALIFDVVAEAEAILRDVVPK